MPIGLNPQHHLDMAASASFSEFCSFIVKNYEKLHEMSDDVFLDFVENIIAPFAKAKGVEVPADFAAFVKRLSSACDDDE